MPRRVDDDVMSFFRFKENLRCIDRDALILLFFQGIEKKGKLELLALAFTDIFNKIQFPRR